MCLRVCAIASGSKGNCYYIGDGKVNILVDCGISFLETKKRLSEIDVNISNIDIILNTHSHVDHIKGVDTFLKNTNTIFYSQEKNSTELENRLHNLSIRNWFMFDGVFYIGDIAIYPIEVSHDVPCVGYIFYKNNKKISIITDLGYTTNNIKKNMYDSNIVYIESNYDKDMLINGNYPFNLKKRIESNRGHLSNIQCSETCLDLVNNNVCNLVLSHISENNNTIEKAYEETTNILTSNNIELGKDVKVDVAFQHKISTMYKII